MNSFRVLIATPLVSLLAILFWCTIPFSLLRDLISMTMFQLMQWCGSVKYMDQASVDYVKQVLNQRDKSQPVGPKGQATAKNTNPSEKP